MIMRVKKLILVLFVINFANGCSSPTAMLGPMYTFSTSGNIVQASLSYSSNEVITMYTGKTPLENIQDFALPEKNIKKKTLESDEFYNLVKNKIDNTRNILQLSNQ